MNAPMRKHWTQAEFFTWAAAQEQRYEFDGIAPELMTGGTMNHSLITLNIHTALRARLGGKPCKVLGPDAGIATVGNAVRYPDMLVTCKPFAGEGLIVPEPLVVFEVIGSNSSRRDRIVKTREYQAVASIRTYVIVESTTTGMTVLSRTDNTQTWSASALTEDDTLTLPEIGIQIPIPEFYEGVAFN